MGRHARRSRPPARQFRWLAAPRCDWPSPRPSQPGRQAPSLSKSIQRDPPTREAIHLRGRRPWSTDAPRDPPVRWLHCRPDEALASHRGHHRRQMRRHTAFVTCSRAEISTRNRLHRSEDYVLALGQRHPDDRNVAFAIASSEAAPMTKAITERGARARAASLLLSVGKGKPWASASSRLTQTSVRGTAGNGLAASASQFQGGTGSTFAGSPAARPLS
jgi:hypothetical protein